MQFDTNTPIYLQIANYICNNILQNREQERLPSVRELGAVLEVNPNTVVRAYEWLVNRNIIYNKRGVGFFVSPDARTQIIVERKEKFFVQKLPSLAQEMLQLGISLEELQQEITPLLTEHKSNTD